MFIAGLFSLPQERGLSPEVPSAPLVENVQRPRTRPGGLAFEKCSPNPANALNAPVLRKRRRNLAETCFELWPQRASQPFLPLQRECSLLLAQNFLRQQSAKRLHQQRF